MLFKYIHKSQAQNRHHKDRYAVLDSTVRVFHFVSYRGKWTLPESYLTVNTHYSQPGRHNSWNVAQHNKRVAGIKTHKARKNQSNGKTHESQNVPQKQHSVYIIIIIAKLQQPINQTENEHIISVLAFISHEMEVRCLYHCNNCNSTTYGMFH